MLVRMEDFIGMLQEAYPEDLMDAGENYRAVDGEKIPSWRLGGSIRRGRQTKLQSTSKK